MTIRKHFSGGRFEEVASYARAKRVGPFFWVAGTTAIEPSGKIHAPGNGYAQSLYIFERIQEAMGEIGCDVAHVTATRAYYTALEHVSGFARAHGEMFKGIDPVLTAVQAGLSQPGLVIEIEVEGVVHDSDGVISF